jgi:hypothetical protein
LFVFFWQYWGQATPLAPELVLNKVQYLGQGSLFCIQVFIALAPFVEKAIISPLNCFYTLSKFKWAAEGVAQCRVLWSTAQYYLEFDTQDQKKKTQLGIFVWGHSVLLIYVSIPPPKLHTLFFLRQSLTV